MSVNLSPAQAHVKRREDVLAHLRAHPDAWLSANDIARVLGGGENSVRRVCAELQAEGLVESRQQPAYAAYRGIRWHLL